jgi:hypothetical protein
MLTREQAAATWCPMARASRTDEGGRCVADQCAMWRWGETKPVTKEQVVEVRVAHVGGGVTTEKRVQQVSVEVPHRGYCGMAGKPFINGSEP